MKRPENYKRLDEALSETIGSKKHRTDFDHWKRTHPDAVEMLTSRARIHSRSGSLLKIRNTIMKSPITKFAAAAVLIICVFLGLNYFYDDSGKAYGMSDVPTLFYTANTIHMKGRIYFPEVQDPKKSFVEIEHWLDLVEGRWRMVVPTTYGGQEGFDISLDEHICDGSDYGMSIDHKHKQVSFAKVSKFHRNLFNHRNVYSIMQLLCSDIEGFYEYVKIDEETIDGHTYQVWEAVFPQVVNEYDSKVTSWLSPKTGEFAKAIIWMRKAGEDWKKKMEMDLVERNVPLSDEIFNLQIPAGYTSTNTKETAQNKPISSFGGGLNNYRLWTHLLFVLPDGSLVLCWSSEDTEIATSQQELFKDLKIGGEFPKLPFQVDALNVSYKGETVTFTGHHLAYTIKDNKFYEWSIYTSLKQINPEYAQLLTFYLVYSDNIKDPEIKGSFSVGIMPSILIKDREEFNEIFTGAIKELSDKTDISQELSYASVMQLARELRK